MSEVLSKESVSARISRALQGSDLRRARRELIAEQLGIHPCTMSRRLEEEGSSWTALIEAERKSRLSKQLHAPPTAAELKQELGFTEHRSVYRFVQKVFGVPLRQLQQQALAA